MLPFADRRRAGRRLGAALLDLAGRQDLIVLGLPRGGVPVAFEVARALDAPLDVLVVRKLGVPGRAELAMGAIASGGLRVLQETLTAALEIPEAAIDEVVEHELEELHRREEAYRAGRPPPDLRGRAAILVDDGLATGSSMAVAIAAARAGGAARVVAAVPVAPFSTCAELGELADEVRCLATPEPFLAVSAWYEDFAPTGDGEVRELLARGR